MSVRATDIRHAVPAALLILLAAMFVAAGCGDDPSDPTYPPQPEPEIGNWLLGVWGSAPDDVYVVGRPGLIYHWNGSVWLKEESGTEQALTSVWGDGYGAVYVTGHGGTILRKTGDSWSGMSSGTQADLFDVGEYDGQVMACGRDGTLRVLSGGSWVAAPEEVFIRDAEQAVVDTLYLSEQENVDIRIESLTSIGHYGITGADGSILMEDPETAWQLRRVTGGEDWVTCSSASEQVSGNFVATDGGRMFHLELSVETNRLVWREVYSPARESDQVYAIVYGIYADQGDTVWTATNDGRIIRIDPPYTGATELRSDGLVLFDIWGTSGTNLYAVGIDARVLHFHEINPGEFGWEIEELPDLPSYDKRHADPLFDKFGRHVP
jgi:hypothetical protein